MKPPITLHRMDVVIIGFNHNPSILNPDFLWRNKIVPEKMTLADKNSAVSTLSTPLQSFCIFQSGLRIESTPDRITFTALLEKESAEDNRATCIAAAVQYLRVVPLVQYVVVGVNFTGVFAGTKKTDPSNLIKAGEWCKFERASPTTEITLSYKLDKRDVNLTVKRDKLFGPEKPSVVFARGNFHHPILPPNESHLAAIDIIGDWKNDLKFFHRLVENIHTGMKL